MFIFNSSTEGRQERRENVRYTERDREVIREGDSR